MDTLIDSADIIKYILKETENDLSLDIDETIWVPYVDYSMRTVFFPFYQEALLILDEIGTQDQFLCFYFALYMLQNDDYELGEELLNKLCQSEFPSCSNAESLYEAIITKQLFIMLHECGHYLNFSKKAYGRIFEECLIKNIYIPNEVEEPVDDEIKSWMTSVLANKNIDEEHSKHIVGMFANANKKQNAKEYFGSLNKTDETQADLAAMWMLGLYVRPLLNVSVRNVLKTINYVDTLVLLERIMKGTLKKDELIKIEQDFLVDLTRQRVSSLFAYQFFDDDDSFNDEEYYRDVYKKGVSFGLKIVEYKKFIDSWNAGNNRVRDEQQYKKLHEMIYRCSVALKQLYQFERRQ